MDRVCQGDNLWAEVVESPASSLAVAPLEKDNMELIDQTWMFESSEPDKRKLDVKSSANAVTGCKCDAGVVT